MSRLKISRRKFLQWLGSFTGITAFILWISGTKRTLAVNAPSRVTFNPANFNDGISFHDDIIIIKRQNDLKIFSSRCTHLGCKITHGQNDKLVCPCHGSQFSMNGNVLNGPAIKPLQLLDYKTDVKTGDITVHVS